MMEKSLIFKKPTLLLQMLPFWAMLWLVLILQFGTERLSSVLLQSEWEATQFCKTEFTFLREPESEAMYLLDQTLFFKGQLSMTTHMYQWVQLSVMLLFTQEDSLQLEQ